MQGVTPLIFFIFNQFYQLKRRTKILQGATPCRFFSVRVTPEPDSAFNCAKKNKVIPAEGQQINSKYYTDQDRVLILRRI